MEQLAVLQNQRQQASEARANADAIALGESDVDLSSKIRTDDFSANSRQQGRAKAMVDNFRAKAGKLTDGATEDELVEAVKAAEQAMRLIGSDRRELRQQFESFRRTAEELAGQVKGSRQ